MAFPSKDYDRLKSLCKKWGVSKEDIFYAVENGILRACIWLPLRYVERITINEERKFVFERQEHQCGFVGVRPQDCRRICTRGCAKLRIFNSVKEDDHIIRLAYEPPQPDISVRIDDLVILKEDQKHFEESYHIEEIAKSTPAENKKPEQLSASEDFRYIKLRGEEYHLGDIQARIIQMLYDASLSHSPWVHGKTLVFESGSQAVRLRDLFRNKRTWQGLIVSNERGYYRLNVPIDQSLSAA